MITNDMNNYQWYHISKAMSLMSLTWIDGCHKNGKIWMICFWDGHHLGKAMLFTTGWHVHSHNLPQNGLPWDRWDDDQPFLAFNPHMLLTTLW